MKKPYRVAGVFSGGGSTVAAIRAATQPGEILHGLVEFVLGIATNAEAGGIDKLVGLGMEEGDNIVILPFEQMGSVPFAKAALDLSRQFAIDHFGLYGCIPTMPKELILALANENVRSTNQHPAWVPDFGGVGMIGKRAVAAQLLFERMLPRGNDFKAAAVCQALSPVVDGGRVLCFKTCPILPLDDPDSLQARLLPIEHEVQIEALRRAALKQLVQVACPSPVKSGERQRCDWAKQAAFAMYREGFPYKWDLATIWRRRNVD